MNKRDVITLNNYLVLNKVVEGAQMRTEVPPKYWIVPT